jgi:hypothetical protein
MYDNAGSRPTSTFTNLLSQQERSKCAFHWFTVELGHVLSVVRKSRVESLRHSMR